MTGGTGFLGSFLAVAMLKKGHFVYFLARGSKFKSASERINDALNFIDRNYLLYKGRFQVLEGDVCDSEQCGLSKRDFVLLKNDEINEIWHLAGSISFAEQKRKETWLANVEGTKNILALSALLNPEQFHFSSTAYVCGNVEETFFEDQLNLGQAFYNPYEETKFIAEKLVRQWADKFPLIKTLIFRPSIIVGDSTDGKVCGYSGYYTYMRVYYLLRKTLLKKTHLVQWNGERIILPIRVPGVYSSPLNIVTIDYAVELMLRLASKSKPGTYHITADNPAPYGFWLDQGTRYLGFEGVEVGNRVALQEDEFLRLVESEIFNGVRYYLPYIRYQPTFNKTNSKNVLGAEYLVHQIVNPELIGILLGYAAKHDFREQHKTKGDGIEGYNGEDKREKPRLCSVVS